MKDELTAAIASIWAPRLKAVGFTRSGRRDLVRVSDGIIQRINFQLAAGGSRDFCVNVAACTICGNEYRVLQPGFRLRNENGRDLWLPSRTRDQALSSAEIAWAVAERQALPWLDTTGTLQGLLVTIGAETWGSQHDQRFQLAVIEALLGRADRAQADAQHAKELYGADPHEWATAGRERADQLLRALSDGHSQELLATWFQANKTAHGMA